MIAHESFEQLAGDLVPGSTREQKVASWGLTFRVLGRLHLAWFFGF